MHCKLTYISVTLEVLAVADMPWLSAAACILLHCLATILSLL
jgi:hypothetical protein